MKRAIFFVLLLTLEHNSFSQNLVVNPGFETWETLTKPTGWTKADNCLSSNSVLNSGIYSCRHEGGTSNTKYLGQTLTVIPGRLYRFSFYYKTEIAGTGSGCRQWCYWKDSKGISITDPATEPLLRPAKSMKSEIWQQVSVDIVAPDTAFYFYLEVRTNQNSIAYWDDFVFAENITTNNSEEKLSDIKIYPNPAHDYLIINNIQNLQRIDIQNITGTPVWSSNFSGEETVTITVSGFAEGLYIIRIRTSDKIITRKFIRKVY
jgi:hypothetical protein